MIEVTKATRDKLKVQASLEGITMKAYLARIANERHKMVIVEGKSRLQELNDDFVNRVNRPVGEQK